MINNSRKIAEYTPDDLIASTIPAIQVAGGTIAGLDKETELKRGTILAKDSTGKLAILSSAENLTPDCILCDDTVVGTDDVTVAVYTAGCFNLNKVIVADEYTITEADKDALRCRNIVFKAAATL